MPTWSKDDITKAAEMANAHHFISEMTKQYDTEAGEKGTQLSGDYKLIGLVTNKKAHNYWAISETSVY